MTKCERDSCHDEAVEFFEYNDNEGINFCWKHYGEQLDALEQLTPKHPPIGANGKKQWWDADELRWKDTI